MKSKGFINSPLFFDKCKKSLDERNFYKIPR